MTKATEYAALVADRKACHCCAGLENPADVASGALDSAQIGPWSLWQGNLDARVMVVGQDWGDVAYFETNRGRDVVHNPTNRVLIELLAIAGVEVDPLGTREPRHTAFFTNAILCLKSGLAWRRPRSSGPSRPGARAQAARCQPGLWQLPSNFS